MKSLILAGLLIVVFVIGFGSPLPLTQPEVGRHWGSAVDILPMSFMHRNHTTDGCVTCHHNFVDESGDAECMICHVTDSRVSHLLREQFHDFCMGCHLERQISGDPSGPVRRCIDCHLYDRVP